MRKQMQEAIVRATLRLPRPMLRRLAGPPRQGRETALDTQVQVLLKLADVAGLTTDLHTDVPTLRQSFNDQAPEVGPRIPRGISITERTAPGAEGPLRIRIYRPEQRTLDAQAPAPAVVYFHGGGFVLGSLESHDALCRKLCLDSGCVVAAVAYRLAPEHPFPAPMEDALAAFRSLVAQAGSLGLDPSRLAVAGDSAGANLATVVAQCCARSGETGPCFQLLFYPSTDASRDWPSFDEFGRGLFLTRSQLLWFRQQYLPDPAQRRDPRASPLRADSLDTLPPTWLATAGFDVLRDEGESYAARLEAAGVSLVHHHQPSLIHGYANMSGVIDAARRSVEEAAQALRRALQPDPTPEPFPTT